MHFICFFLEISNMLGVENIRDASQTECVDKIRDASLKRLNGCP
jgi:hypothetical protein